ncbi:MAG: phage tail tube protein [Deltaproteobacteria bacterium]
MTTAATAAFGTILTRNNNPIAELTNIGDIELSQEFIDVTTHDSTGGYREFVAAKIREAGEVAVEGNFLATDTDGQIGLKNDLEAGTVQNFVITFPEGTSWTFTAVVSKFSISSPLEKQMGFSATLKIAGKPTLATSASIGLSTPFFSISNDAVIVPAPSGTTYQYIANVLTGVSSVTVTPTATAGIITVNGNTVASGQPSGAIALGAAGSITEIKIVVSETGKSPKIYTIQVVRAAS